MIESPGSADTNSDREVIGNKETGRRCARGASVITSVLAPSGHKELEMDDLPQPNLAFNHGSRCYPAGARPARGSPFGDCACQ